MCEEQAASTSGRRRQWADERASRHMSIASAQFWDSIADEWQRRRMPGDDQVSRVIDSLGIRLGPGRDNQRGGGPTLQVWFAGTIEILPDLFRDKGHERVQEAQALVEYGSQDTSRGLAGCIITLHLHFGSFHVPITVIGPEEFVDLPSRLTKLEVIDQARDAIGQVLKT